MSLGIAGFAAAALAQTPPNAGALQREVERELRPPQPAPQLLAPPAPMKESVKGATVTVRSFSIEGATLVPSATLNGLLDDLIGKSLSFADLERAAQRIAEHYRTLGWFARVYLPEQDITAGVVRIVVIEGKLSAVDVDRNRAARADADFVRETVLGDQQPGQPLSAAALERGLLLASDLSGIRTTGILEAGGKIGETRMNLKVEDTPLLRGDIGLSNQGVKSTGTVQLNGGVSFNDLSGRGDRLDLRALAARDLTSVRAGYSVPLTSDGVRLNLRMSGLDYRLGDRFAALDAKGHARSAGGDIGYPVIRSRESNVMVSAGLETRHSSDDGLGAPLRRHDIDTLVLGLSGDWIDSWQGGGYSSYSVNAVHGRLGLGDVASDIAADLAGPQARGDYDKLTAQASRLQRLPEDFTLSLKLSVQWAGNNLDSSEQLSLGGPSGVRAYPVNEANGDEGWLLRMELRRPFADGWQALAFVDSGGIRLHHQTWAGWQGGSNVPNDYRLSGAGIGVVWSRPNDWSIALTLAAPLGSNPGRDASGNNSDGSGQHSVHAWLDASKLF